MNEKGDQTGVDDMIKKLILYVGDKTSEGGSATIESKDCATFDAKSPLDLIEIITFAIRDELFKGNSGRQSQLRLAVKGMKYYGELKRPEEPRRKMGFHHQSNQPEE